MMEQDVPVGAAAASVSLGRALSDEARASLEAVRTAQEAGRLRARRQTVRARIWFAVGLGAAGLVAVAIVPRMAGGREARPQATAAALPSLVAPEPALAPPAVTPPAAEPVVAPAPVAAAAQAPAASAAPAAPAASAEGCDTALIRSAPWRLSARACARAFDADPTNARLALAVAQAEHSHGSVAEAKQWAKRALALDRNAAEAYVLIARADVAGGRREEARAAYRHYLELAPHGWHQAEARATLRGARAVTSE